MFLLYHAYVYLEFLILACTIYILAPRNLEAPVNGSFYFVITTALLWYFNNGWVQVTSNESGDSHPDIKFIDTVIPELGTSSTLYVNTVNQNITVWSDELQKYIEVADVTCSITQEEILNLF